MTVPTVSCTNCGKNFTTDDLRGTSCKFCGTLLAHHARAAQQVAVINQMMADRNGNGIPDECECQGGALPAIYCTAKQNSLGCLPAIAFLGVASVSSPAPFVISASGIRNNKPGLLLYGFQPAALPFQGGTLCIAAPVKRSPGINSGGTPSGGGNDCSGILEIDFNAFLQSGAVPALLVVGPEQGYAGLSDVFVDLRVDDHERPLEELRRLFGLHQELFGRTPRSQWIEVDDELRTEIEDRLAALGFDHLEDWAGEANLEERVDGADQIDPFVLERLRQA